MENIIKAITKEDISNLPRFLSHNDAKKYFTDKYGDRFLLVAPMHHSYFYTLVLNVETYMKSFEEFKDKKSVDNVKELLASHQMIQISENGKVHLYID